MNQALCTNSRGEEATLVEVTSSAMTHGWGVRRGVSESVVPAGSSLLEGFAEGWPGWWAVQVVQNITDDEKKRKLEEILSELRQFISDL